MKRVSGQVARGGNVRLCAGRRVQQHGRAGRGCSRRRARQTWEGATCTVRYRAAVSVRIRYSVTGISRGINNIITQQRAWGQGAAGRWVQRMAGVGVVQMRHGCRHRAHGRRRARTHRWWRRGWPRPSHRCGTPAEVQRAGGAVAWSGMVGAGQRATGQSAGQAGKQARILALAKGNH